MIDNRYRRSRGGFDAYIVSAVAVFVAVLGISALGVWRAVAPSPAPTVTETSTVTVSPTPAPTVTVTAKPKPLPAVTVTAEPKPAPTVTVTVTATPSVEATGTPAPMVLNVDTLLSPGWQIERAARIWNDALGCEVFTTKMPAKVGELQQLYWVTETRGLALDGEGVWALHTPGWPQGTIEFDPSTGIRRFIAVHELGHALGLHHSDAPRSIMNVDLADRELPSPGDIAQAKRLQVKAGRCAS